MLAPYPESQPAPDERAEAEFALLRNIIVGVRNVRNEYKVEPARWVAATVVAGAQAELLRGQASLVSKLARVAPDQLLVAHELAERPAQAAALVFGDVEVLLPLAGLIDLDAERARLARELQAAEDEIRRREGKLGNESFVGRAPEAVVQRERDGLAAAQSTAARLRTQLAALG
jgi:valyl-tRNA synthetase